MTISHLFVGPHRIDEIIIMAENQEMDRWVYFKDGGYYLANYHAKDYDDKEYDDLMAQVKKSGYKSYLQLTMIEDCILNLIEQINNPTVEQKIDSVKFYYEHDAFIEIQKGST